MEKKLESFYKIGDENYLRFGLCTFGSCVMLIMPLILWMLTFWNESDRTNFLFLGAILAVGAAVVYVSPYLVTPGDPTDPEADSGAIGYYGSFLLWTGLSVKDFNRFWLRKFFRFWMIYILLGIFLMIIGMANYYTEDSSPGTVIMIAINSLLYDLLPIAVILGIAWKIRRCAPWD